MATPTSPSTLPLVLVTGVSGYLGVEVALDFLRTTLYTVRGTVRLQSQADAFLAAYPEWKDSISFVLVPSFDAARAFDEAVKGVDYVVHTASPVPLGGVEFDPERDLLIPAIRGTVGVLEAALLEQRIKAVVITSSVAAIRDYRVTPKACYTSEDWNPLTYDEAKALPSNLAHVQYSGSKALAERAAWDFMNTHKPPFTLTTILPTFILGPSHEPSLRKMSDLRSSTGLFWRSIVDVPSLSPNNSFPKAVDIRDVSNAHVQAIARPETSGKRYLLVAHDNSIDYTASILRTQFPEQAHRIPEPKNVEKPEGGIEMDGSLAEKAFGFKYRSMESTIQDWGASIFSLPA